jgi:glutamate racemase
MYNVGEVFNQGLHDAVAQHPEPPMQQAQVASSSTLASHAGLAKLNTSRAELRMPKICNVTASAKAAATTAPTARAIESAKVVVATAAGRIMMANNLRGLSNFYVRSSAMPAADALLRAKHVMLLTGFSVAQNMPETDGPPGTAALGTALQKLGKRVTYVTDSSNAPVLKASVGAYSQDAAAYTRFLKFDANHGADAERHAKDVLDIHKPDLVVAIELPGRNAEGIRRNMRGVNIDPFNKPVDQLLIEANARRLTTIGVGDGGNEAGMGNLEGIPRALDNTLMASAVPAQHQVTAWNSNLGAEVLAGLTLHKAGRGSEMQTAQQQDAAIRAALDAGAVDGVTRGKAANERTPDGLNFTGVDGHSIGVHNAMLELLKTNLAKLPPHGVVATKTPSGTAPFMIGAFDSSNGGLIAARNLAQFISYRSGHDARFTIVVDHGNAPYGDKNRGELITLVGNGLKTAQNAGVDVIAMACNTACTAFPEAHASISRHVPVIDLIEVTADAMAKHGGAKPVLIATEATANDSMYGDRLRAASRGRIGLHESIGAKSWAPLINARQHLSKSDEDQEYVKGEVQKFVDKVPRDATSVWLCCTHYPALKGMIEARMKERKLDHIAVIDPMEYQAERLIEHMDRAPVSNRATRRTKTLVLTTGDEADVKRSSDALFGQPSNVVKTTFDNEESGANYRTLLPQPVQRR